MTEYGYPITTAGTNYKREAGMADYGMVQPTQERPAVKLLQDCETELGHLFDALRNLEGSLAYYAHTVPPDPRCEGVPEKLSVSLPPFIMAINHIRNRIIEVREMVERMTKVMP